ncbi:MAG: hypothetical protein QOI10_30 [Solirubrobacterales bacterium]|jgi:hypothetical protein|nr:hypothetical protein [Solirubrobacterales bacterium]
MPVVSRLAPLAAVLASLALLVAPASASVPNGTYECFNLGYNFTLKAHDKYKVQTGGGGKWTSKGSKVKFKSGPMDFAYGKLRKDQTGAPVIDLYDVGDDTYYDNCPKV